MRGTQLKILTAFALVLFPTLFQFHAEALVAVRKGKSKDSSAEVSGRVKRGYGGGGHSTGIAYNRVHDSGQLRTVSDRGHKGEHLDPLGEDGSHIADFKSYGVGYEHRHANHCEESKCGYNIRHCPHGCVFNSFTCGGGASYDTCCC